MSTYIKGYKYRIYPDEEQSKQLDTFINLSRKVYNWGVAKEEERFEQYKQDLCEYGFYTFIELCTLFTEERNKPENYWLKEIPNTTARLALRNVVQAFKNFFSKKSNYPKFKSKKHSKPSFNTRKERFSIKNDSIRIEGMKTRIDLGFDCGLNLNSAINPAISRDNLGRYYVSFSLEEEIQELSIPKSEPIGIDLGHRQNFVLSTGEVYNHPKTDLDKLKRRRSRIQRKVTRDQKRRLEESMRTKTKYEDIPKSKRAIKTENRLKRLNEKIHNKLNTSQHTIAKRIVERNPEFVVMETFSVTEIGKNNKYMYKLLWEDSFYEATQIIKNKCEKYNIPFIQAPMEFPSTKTCSYCGSIKNLHGAHEYKCPMCGMKMDRDINAAINLRNYGLNLIYN